MLLARAKWRNYVSGSSATGMVCTIWQLLALMYHNDAPQPWLSESICCASL